MSLQPQKLPEIPEETARIAKILFPKGNKYMWLRDELDAIYNDEQFTSRNHMYLFPLGKRILAIRAVSSGISGNFWGCRDIAFLLLFSTFLLASYCPSPKYPSFSLSLSIPLANRVF